MLGIIVFTTCIKVIEFEKVLGGNWRENIIENLDMCMGSSPTEHKSSAGVNMRQRLRKVVVAIATTATAKSQLLA